MKVNVLIALNAMDRSAFLSHSVGLRSNSWMSCRTPQRHLRALRDDTGRKKKTSRLDERLERLTHGQCLVCLLSWQILSLRHHGTTVLELGRWYPEAEVSRVARKTGKIHLTRRPDQNGVALLQDSLIFDDK